MQRLQRFRWIPMLLKAWNEARERTEARQSSVADPTAPTQETASGNHPTTVSKHGRSAKTALAPGARPTKRPVRRLQHPVNQSVQRRLRARPLPRANYQAVLQELREAKQQLGQLDSIRHQLDEMQAWFEQRMSTQTGTPVNSNQGHQSKNMGHSLPAAPIQNPTIAGERIGPGQGVHTDPQKEGSE